LVGRTRLPGEVLEVLDLDHRVALVDADLAGAEDLLLDVRAELQSDVRELRVA
jgi:hypothetical protein